MVRSTSTRTSHNRSSRRRAIRLLPALLLSIMLAVAVAMELTADRHRWSEEITGKCLHDRRPSARFLALVGGFMVALGGFYEPFLDLVGMARWQEGTRTILGVPLIACVGHPTLTVPFVVLWCEVMRRFRGLTRTLWIAAAVPALGVAHAWGLAHLKGLLGW